MDWKEFARKTGLPGEAEGEMEKLGVSEEEYARLRLIYRKSHEQFFEKVLEKKDSSLYFLFLYCRFACETYEKYKEDGIEEAIFWDTFLDIRLWCENYCREYGKCGIGAYDWLWRHVDMTLLRLGRLQFEEMSMPYQVGQGEKRISQGVSVISLHIPQGEPLCKTECIKSLKRAFERWGTQLFYVCHSWLLDPGLNALLGEGANILEFQKLFEILEIDYKMRETERRIFDRVLDVISDYPERTSLQRSVKAHLLKGNVLGNGWGVLKKEAVESRLGAAAK